MAVTLHSDIARKIKAQSRRRATHFSGTRVAFVRSTRIYEVLREGEQCGNENNVVSVAATERDDRSDRRGDELALACGQGTTGAPLLAGAGTLAAQPGDAPCPGETLRRPLPGVTGQKHY